MKRIPHIAHIQCTIGKIENCVRNQEWNGSNSAIRNLQGKHIYASLFSESVQFCRVWLLLQKYYYYLGLVSNDQHSYEMTIRVQHISRTALDRFNPLPNVTTGKTYFAHCAPCNRILNSFWSNMIAFRMIIGSLCSLLCVCVCVAFWTNENKQHLYSKLCKWNSSWCYFHPSMDDPAWCWENETHLFQCRSNVVWMCFVRFSRQFLLCSIAMVQHNLLSNKNDNNVIKWMDVICILLFHSLLVFCMESLYVWNNEQNKPPIQLYSFEHKKSKQFEKCTTAMDNSNLLHLVRYANMVLKWHI